MKVELILVRKNKLAKFKKDKKDKKDNKKTYKRKQNMLYAISSVGIAGSIKTLENKLIGTAFNNYSESIAVIGGPITNGFQKSLLPILYDIGATIFIATSAFSFYSIIRKDVKKGIDGLKWAAIGFIGLRFTEVFVKIIDEAARNAVGNM